jgi:hypothetical protein
VTQADLARMRADDSDLAAGRLAFVARYLERHDH